MATPKKKHLIELMIAANVIWPEGAEYAAQDKSDKIVHFYKLGKPDYWNGDCQWMAGNCTHMSRNRISIPELCRNWNRTIVTREQYEKALADVSKVVVNNNADGAVVTVAPSIEQLTADYHTKADEAKRLQSVADEALKAADDALLELKKAGELIGLVISINTKPKQVEQQLSSAEWKVGDKCIVTGSPDDSEWVGRECVLTRIDGNDESLPYRVYGESLGDFWVASIRRP